MRTIQATEAKAKLSELLDEVERGGQIEITRRGRPVARIVPAREAEDADKKRAFAELRALRRRLPKIPRGDLMRSIREGRE
ncbi:type II toxin-antitoxin system Phd/YefM family antitoxin [Amphiplicatus metriothermophilus]|uniref:Antitoxin n=1 Tax=Amphiplicatus metriothermophilus TaxID=1519374 RepID=A0A239PUB0_9PROT|nr:prevent-host-death family protein [Amphiplicatus metriothermophilus]SNT73718.1 prevent-host-death family protein [Amphiplicatus metriothermophilus]